MFDAAILSAILFGLLVVLIFLGLPLVFSIGASALLVGFVVWGPASLNVVATTTIGTMQSSLLMAIPMFMLMASFLQRSGIADDLYDFMYHSMGRWRGGLGIGSIGICVIFAAMSGVSAAATVTMAMIAVPSMIARGYNKRLSTGLVMAGGALGPLMPPSIPLIVYGLVSGLSVGQLFAGAVMPGLLLAALFALYVFVITRIRNDGPAVPREELASGPELWLKARSVALPGALIVLIFGAIFSGAATPTEASAIGAAGALLCVVVKKRFTLPMLLECCMSTLKMTAMVMWLIVTASWFSNVYAAVDGVAFVVGLVESLNGNAWMILVLILALVIFLGCFLDVSAIILLCVPIFDPVIRTLGFDPLWFAILFAVTLETAYLTPPFGLNLFYMKAAGPPGTRMQDLYMAVLPFILLQVAGVGLLMMFPEIVLWLPRLLFAG
jgi:tripartite ATP-independent transporter DctM subunit